MILRVQISKLFISNKDLTFIPPLIWTESFHRLFISWLNLVGRWGFWPLLIYSILLFNFSLLEKNKDKAVTVHRDAICLLNLAWHLLDTQRNKRNCINIHQQRSQPQCWIWSIICYFGNDNSDSSALMISQYIAWLIFYSYEYNLFFHFMSCLSFVPKIWK